MEKAIAESAVVAALGRNPDRVSPLASGKSSNAWACLVGDEQWVVRVPIPDSGRRMSYRSEALLGEHLASLGHRVATWTLVDVDGVSCSVAPLLAGSPIGYDRQWTDDFAASLGATLGDLHSLPAARYGPLQDVDSELVGQSLDPKQGVVARWFQASVWPFDSSSLPDHAANAIVPAALDAVASLEARIVAAASEPFGVLHSDLHAEHLLVTPDGDLAAVLDFGDAFIGSTAWDFALLHWYYGSRNAELVASHYPNGFDVSARGLVLAVAVGLYKISKNPNDPAVPARLAVVLSSVSADT